MIPKGKPNLVHKTACVELPQLITKYSNRIITLHSNTLTEQSTHTEAHTVVGYKSQQRADTCSSDI